MAFNAFELFANITLDTGEYEKNLNDAGKKTSSFGSKLKSGLATAAKVGAAALGAAATAVGALAKASLDAYADQEQLVGGVETLFGAGGKSLEQYAEANGKTVDEVKDQYERLMQSQQTVLDNAARAYETAGMSANEYMETVTGFSASLLQSLGGDTQRAAEVADVAITDMADNANKMGTSMESIQYAYQGFAKQNYTMLDNLKLGYGGTKEEMERLIADANALKQANGEMADLTIDSYADVVEAIHLVQTEMGITGTTHDEAAKTIQGSLSAMKSAWKNLVAGIADENADLDRLMDNVVDSVVTVGRNILPRVEQILNGIGTAIQKIAPVISDELPGVIETVLPTMLTAGGSLLTGLIQGIITAIPTLATSAVQVVTQLVTYLIENVPTLVQAAGTLVQALVTGIMEALPQLLSAGGQMLSELVNGIIEGLPGMMERLPEVINGFLGFITEQLPSVLAMGVELLTNLAYGIINAIPEFVAQLPAIFESFVGFIVTNLPMIVDAGITLLENLLIGIIQAIPEFVTQLPTIIENFTNVIIANLPVIINAGITLLEHLITGIIHAIPELVANLPKIINGIVDGLTAMLGSIVDIGANIVKGLWEGIQSLASWLWEKVSGWISGIWDGIKEFFGISSPSKEMAWVGKMLTKGLSKGISDNAEDAVKAAEDMAKDVADVNFGLGTVSGATIATENTGRPGTYSTGEGSPVKSLAGATITININGANIQNDRELAERISFELQMLMGRRSAAFGTA